MADDPKQEEPNRLKKELDDILGRVDSLPVLDPRPADEVIGYDEDGLLTRNGISPMPTVPSESPGNDFDLEAYKEEALSNPKAREAMDFFLKHRHREWEENLG